MKRLLACVVLVACDGPPSEPPDARPTPDAGRFDGPSFDASVRADAASPTMWCAELAACCDTLSGLDHDNCVDAVTVSAGDEFACRGFLQSIQGNGACS